MKSIYKTKYEIFIDCLKNERLKSKMTQKELSESIGVDQTIVSKIEHCIRRIDVIELMMICKALQIDLNSFLKDVEEKIKGI
jgi:transcriptional regulator with XRE-family HTH domain